MVTRECELPKGRRLLQKRGLFIMMITILGRRFSCFLLKYLRKISLYAYQKIGTRYGVGRDGKVLLQKKYGCNKKDTIKDKKAR